MQSHIRKVYACLAVTCHLHFWQNDRDLLRATAVGLVFQEVRISYGQGEEAGGGDGVRGCGSAQT